MAAALLVAAAVTPSAAAADACPNAAMRAGASAGLPDCRAYEQVTPHDKGGNSPRYGFGVAPGGGGVAYRALGAFPGSGAESNLGGNYVSRRGADGWSTTIINPPTPGRPPVLGDEMFVVGLDAALSRTLVATRYPSDAGDQDIGSGGGTNLGNFDLYASAVGGPFSWLSQGPAIPDATRFDVHFGGASSDHGRIFVQTRVPLTPEIAGTDDQHIYVFAGGSRQVVDHDENGDLLTGGAGIGTNGASTSPNASIPRQGTVPDETAVSADGSAVSFTAPLDGSAPRQVYVRAGGVTKMASQSQDLATLGDPAPTGATFSVAARDGSRVLFESTSKLTADAPAGGALYGFDVATDTLQFLAPMALRTNVAAASPDLQHVYLCDNRTNISLLRGTTVTPLATGRCEDERATWTPASGYVFTSTASLTGQPTGGLAMAYLYDARGGSLVCLSCRPDGSVPQGAAGLTASLEPFPISRNVRNLTDDGNRAFFVTTDPLSPRDVNGANDVYQWSRGGAVDLISAGTDPDGVGYLGASADGSDVFFLTYKSLVSGDVDGETADVYDARVGGGLPQPAQPPIGGPAPAGPAGTVPSGPAIVSGDPVPPPPVPPGGPPPPPAPEVGVPDRSVTADGRGVELRLDLPGAGELDVTLEASDAVLARGSSSADAAGPRTVTLRLTRSGQRRLERRGRLSLTLRWTFTPAGQDDASASGTTDLTLASGDVAVTDRRLRVRGGAARAAVAVGGPGRIRVKVRSDGAVLARGHRSLKRAGVVRVRLRLTRAGSRAVRREGRVRGRLTATYRPHGGGGRVTDHAAATLRGAEGAR